MKFMFLNEAFLPALIELAGEFGFEIVEKEQAGAIKVQFKLCEKSEAKVEKLEDTYIISAGTKPHLFLALSQMIFRQKRNESLEFTLNPYFDKNGLMIDNSRNGVVSVKMVKKLLKYMAFMGQSWYMLYMEDVYEIEGEPYFGYLRGRYSKADLKELDDYADMLGIELIPCVQSLAHLNQFLRWEHEANKYIDIDDILNVGNEATIALLDKMLKNLSECFRTRTIHIGMDEAMNVGRGKYLDENGYIEKKDIMKNHLYKMLELCSKYNLKPMIWDDMFFAGHSSTECKVDYDIPDEIELMYWDYYKHKKQEYLDRIDAKQKIAKDVSFAGGAWRWTGFVPHHEKTLITTKAALSACREKGLKRVIATSWGDDGSETPFFATLFGGVLFSFLDVYENYDEELFDAWLLFYTNMSLEQWLWQGKFDLLDGFKDEAYLDATTSKYLLYQDVLLSHFAYYCESITDDYDSQLDKLYENFSNQDGGWKTLNEFYAQYARVLRLKWRLPLDVLNAYKKDDKNELRTLIDTRILPLRDELSKLIELRKDIWFEECNASGMEVLEYKLGGQIFRLSSVAKRLESYINNEIGQIEELEEERLDPVPHIAVEGAQATRYVRSLKTMSVNHMGW